MKYGKENFQWEILEACYSLDDANRLEQYYIKYYNTFTVINDSHGYNMTMGGDGVRGLGGDRSVHHKLSKDQVVDIINNDMPTNEVAKKYNISWENANSIRCGETWKDMDRSNAPVYQTRYWITKDIAYDIIMSPRSTSTITRDYNITKETVNNIRRGRRYPDIDRTDAPVYDDDRTPITSDIATLIITDHRDSTTMSKIYNVTRKTINNIRTGRRWNHLDRSNAPIYDKVK